MKGLMRHVHPYEHHTSKCLHMNLHARRYRGTNARLPTRVDRHEKWVTPVHLAFCGYDHVTMVRRWTTKTETKQKIYRAEGPDFKLCFLLVLVVFFLFSRLGYADFSQLSLTPLFRHKSVLVHLGAVILHASGRSHSERCRGCKNDR